MVESTACHWQAIKVCSYHLDNNLVINENISLQSNQKGKGKRPIMKIFPRFVRNILGTFAHQQTKRFKK